MKTKDFAALGKKPAPYLQQRILLMQPGSEANSCLTKFLEGILLRNTVYGLEIPPELSSLG